MLSDSEMSFGFFWGGGWRGKEVMIRNFLRKLFEETVIRIHLIPIKTLLLLNMLWTRMYESHYDYMKFDKKIQLK